MITVGEVLKNKRETLKISLEKASSETKIQKRYLQYIEKNEFFPFQSEVFLTGFIKIYAKYLNLNVEKVLALYRRTNPVFQKEEVKAPTKKPFYQVGRINITPKSVIYVILAISIVSIIGYLASQIHKFQTPPKLEIINPIQDTTSTEEIFLVKGNVEKNVSVEINDVVVETNDSGFFEKEIELTEGVNLLTIKAKKNNNNILETIETRKITYTKTEEKPTVEENTDKKITLEVFDSPAWIKLDIDDENKLAQVVNPSKKDFTIKKKLNIITGRVTNSKLLFNDKEIAWTPSSSKGIVEMECTVIENTLECK